MKIHPPELTIDPTNPFNDSLYNRRDFAGSLTRLITSVEDSLVIFINAPWGEGKTTFAKMWCADLLRQKYNPIYFDAYAADYYEDPFVCFSGEILRAVDKGAAKAKREFKKTCVKVAKGAIGLGLKIGVRAATANLVSHTDLALLREKAPEIAGGIDKIIERKLEDYGKEKEALVAFKESLKILAAEFRKSHGFPLTIIVDELDRCRPDFALSLLERIKHLFEVEGVVFVLLVNREQIEEYIRNLYGREVNAVAYLQKFADLFVDLPNQEARHHAQLHHREYCNSLMRHYGICTPNFDPDRLAETLLPLVDHFRLTLRQIEKTFGIITPAYMAKQRSDVFLPQLIALLSVLKATHPRIYQKLSRGTLSLGEFFHETGLNQMSPPNREAINWDWFKSIIEACLMTETEYAEAVKNKNPREVMDKDVATAETWLKNAGVRRRRDAVPQVCRHLDMFSFQP
jgi:hypothetical protein